MATSCRRCACSGGAGQRQGAPDHPALWLELQADRRDRAPAGQGRLGRRGPPRRRADGLGAGRSVRRRADGRDQGPPVPAAGLHLGRPEALRRLWLGPADAWAGRAVPHRRPRPGRGYSPRPGCRRPASTSTMRRSSNSPTARPWRCRARRRCRSRAAIRSTSASSAREGMLLFDIERARVEVIRHDGKSHIADLGPECRRLRAGGADHAAGRTWRAARTCRTRPTAWSACGRACCSMRCIARPNRGAWRTCCEAQRHQLVVSRADARRGRRADESARHRGRRRRLLLPLGARPDAAAGGARGLCGGGAKAPAGAGVEPLPPVRQLGRRP